LSQQPPEPQADKKARFLTRDHLLQIGTLLFVVALVAVVVWQRENIMEFSISMARYWGLKYLAIFVLSMVAAATIVIPIPGLAMTSIIGAISVSQWDPLWVGIASGLGATVGETTGYLLGYSGRLAVPDTPNYERVVRWMSHKWGNLAIFLLALIPNPLFDVAGIAAGILKYPLWKFIVIGAAGRLPKHILFSYLGFWGIHLMPMPPPPPR